MANLIPLQNQIVIPPDTAMAAGRPVTGDGVRRLAQSIRWAVEAITGGPCPGEAAATLASTAEWDRPHDHSGLVGGYHHGTYRGLIASCPIHLLPCCPFSAWPSGWAASQHGILPAQAQGITPLPSFWTPNMDAHWAYLRYNQKYDPLYDAIALVGMAPVMVPRGSNAITIHQMCYQVDASGTLTPGEICWATVDSSGSLIDSDYATLGQVAEADIGTYGYQYEQDATLDVAPSGATLAADTAIWILVGLHALDTSGVTKTLLAAQSIDIATAQV